MCELVPRLPEYPINALLFFIVRPKKIALFYDPSESLTIIRHTNPVEITNII